jgi:hypothetical protein
MAEPLLTITVSKDGEGFRADLQAPSGINNVAALRLDGISASAVGAIETCLAELQSKAADGDEVALRFT